MNSIRSYKLDYKVFLVVHAMRFWDSAAVSWNWKCSQSNGLEIKVLAESLFIINMLFRFTWQHVHEWTQSKCSSIMLLLKKQSLCWNSEKYADLSLNVRGREHILCDTSMRQSLETGPEQKTNNQTDLQRVIFNSSRRWINPSTPTKFSMQKIIPEKLNARD